MRTVTMADGRAVPVVGLGTWEMGVQASEREREVRALRRGVELGMTLIDTAEMYGDGGAEEVVGEALRGIQEHVYVVSKVLPENASREGTVAACEASLRRLGIETLDLYLLHWQGPHALADTVEAFEQLRNDGKIRAWGVSNFDTEDMRATVEVPQGANVLANQVLYNLTRRAMESSLQRWCQTHDVLLMAYSPLEQGRLHPEKSEVICRVAERHGVSPATVAVAWTIRHSGVITIPKASNLQHVEENLRAADLELTAADLAELHREFPEPKRDSPLETL